MEAHRRGAVGGNHEASNYLWELYYGGWVAPNIYYLGHAGVVNFGGARVGGLSGIFNQRHYRMVRAWGGRALQYISSAALFHRRQGLHKVLAGDCFHPTFIHLTIFQDAGLPLRPHSLS
jgi:hypothetical protein